MGERGREHVRVHYAMGAVVDRWEASYREMLSRKGAHPRADDIPMTARFNDLTPE